MQHRTNRLINSTCATAQLKLIQFYTIHRPIIGTNVVGTYNLLPNKRRKTTYIEMLNEMRYLNNDHQMGNTITDFEQAVVATSG